MNDVSEIKKETEENTTLEQFEYDVMVIHLSVFTKKDSKRLFIDTLIKFGELPDSSTEKVFDEFVNGKINETRFWRLLDIRDYEKIQQYFLQEVKDRLDDKYTQIMSLNKDYHIYILHDLPNEWFKDIEEEWGFKGISLRSATPQHLIDKIKQENPNSSIFVIDSDINRLLKFPEGCITCLLIERPLVKPTGYPSILLPNFDSVLDLKNIQ